MTKACVFILYNPDIEVVITNINSIKKDVDFIYLIDNSDTNQSYEKLFRSENSIRYINLNGNKGIARALNIGFKQAKEDGVEWVLTMDQDSVIPDNMISKYSGFIKSGNEANIGIITPQINVYKGESRDVVEIISSEVLCYTSGSFTSVDAWEKVGGFKEYLFIDFVDFEFCLDLITNNYKIFKLHSVVMNHELGKTREYRFWGKHLFYVTNHNYIRRYYMTRNMRYVREMYGNQFPGLSEFNGGWRSVWVICKILLFEKDKLRKLRSIYEGIRDYKLGITGKYIRQ